MYCSECGNKIKEGANFCNSCGAPAKKLEVDERYATEELDVLEAEYDRLMEQKKKKDQLEQEISELSGEIAAILDSVESEAKKDDIQKIERPEEEERQEIRFCPYCGTLAEGAKFCPECGSKIRN